MSSKLLAGRAPLVSVLALAVLTACGGGGGDSTPEPTPTPPVPEKALALTASNYQAAAEQALRAGSYLMESSDLLSGAQAGPQPSAIKTAVKQLPMLLSQFKRPATVAAAVINDAIVCSGGGKVDISFNDANNNNAPDEGESILMVASACKEDGVVTSGRIEVSLTKLTGVFDSSNYSAAIAMKLANFSVTSPAGSATGQGELKVSMAATSATQSSLQIEASNFSSSGRLGALEYQQSITNFVISSSSSSSPASGEIIDTATVRGTLASSALDGKTIGIETPIALTFSSAKDYPTAGKMVIKGAANSLVQMTVQANGRVLIELDADGNGSIDSNVTKAWSELY